ncbi:hypothetical protein PUP66_23185 [Pseudomonas chlororaphis]|uniref:hypothetical protein n=1 Tax=Pseudomonas chlororaphis TaxID=587753 RepID=UPI000E0A9868|nr:hypothetical protein [Pseudomonas chlororaphis]AZD17391.1 hypothetical protein C4K25_4480 [Pseudomonas chlororaphis]WDH45968.1 hypothetical protein PUP66_23185 [Pseudomonas chlororaphis]WDH57815.1 hypothetical protein PUP56_23190 [Pseudomonas chlororaphis]WQE17072.1 hypothetical protein U0007_22005 [Pseudomonas chlororaphis]
MNIRNQIARLKQTAGSSQFSNDVRHISELMDELSAAAVGGGGVAREVSLLEIFEAPIAPNQYPHIPKEAQ